jgi:hypothetical protein
MGLFKKKAKVITETNKEIESSGFYVDVVKRPVRHRPVDLNVLKADAKRHKKNQDARLKRAQLRQLDKLTVAVKGQ